MDGNAFYQNASLEAAIVVNLKENAEGLARWV